MKLGVNGHLGAILFLSFALGACGLFQDKHVAEGKKIFNYYCAHCHGEKGYGDGYNSVNVDPRPRDLTDSLEPYMAESSNEILIHSITHGAFGTTGGRCDLRNAFPPHHVTVELEVACHLATRPSTSRCIGRGT